MAGRVATEQPGDRFLISRTSLNPLNDSRRLLGRLPTWLWVALLMALWLAGLNSAPLLDVDEGAFSEASREMLSSGDWGHTTLNGADRFDKPILIYWLQSLGLAVFGVTEAATRLPSACAALMWCLAAVRFAEAWAGARAQRAAAAVVATSLGVMLIGRAATADALLNALMCWACLDLWRHLADGDRAPLRRAFLWMGLGMLTKGPVACLVPGASVLVYLLVSGQIGRLRQVLGDAWAWVIFFGVATPWYAYALHRHGMAFIDGFILQHNVNRFLQTREGHGGQAYYTLLVAPLLALPWAPLLITVLGRLRVLWGEPVSRFLLCWAGFALLFFTFSSTKLPHYLLYGTTPLLILMAGSLAHLRSSGMAVALALSQLLLFGGLSWSQQVAGWLATQTKDPLYQTLLVTASPGPAWWQLAVMGALWLVIWCWPRRALAERAVLGALLGAFWVVHIVLPWWARTLQSPVHELAELARERGAEVVQWRARQPSFAFYLGSPTPSREPAPGQLALVRKDRLKPEDDVIVVAERRGFALVEKVARPLTEPTPAASPAASVTAGSGPAPQTAPPVSPAAR